MLSRQSFFILAAGIAAGIIFAISAYSSAGGILLIYMPAFPLLISGFIFGAKRIMGACLAALLTVALLTDASNAAFFAAFTLLPVFYFVHKALHWRGDGEAREWYPVLAILAELTVIAAALFLVFSVTALLDGRTALEGVLSHEIAGDMNSNATSPELQSVMQWLTGEGSYLLFASTGWSWVLILYAFAAIAHGILVSQGLALRPSLALGTHGLPRGLLGLLALSGLYALIGHGTGCFIAKTLFLLLLLPYFLAGLAVVHKMSRHWRYRRLWLVLFYMVLLFQAWLIAFVAATGLFSQLAEILDKRREIG